MKDKRFFILFLYLGTSKLSTWSDRMNFKLAFIYLLFCCLALKSQSKCEFQFLNDTLSIPEEGKTLEGLSLETTLKNFCVLKIFQSNDPKDDKLYLRLLVTKNFYFNKVDKLELKSGSKSYWVKPDSKQYKISKTLGLFVVRVEKNYIVTLKEEGITSFVFAGAETDFTKSDANQIKKISRCFYETIYGKK